MNPESGSFIEVLSGPLAGRRVALQPGARLTVGSDSAVALVLPDDRMAGVQLAIEPAERGYRLRDLGSPDGTYLNGASVALAPLRDQDRIFAGFTHLLVHLDDLAQPAEEKPPVLQALEPHQPLYAVLDAARAPRVRECLRDSPLRVETLLEGARAEDLAEYGPFLVELPPGAALRETLAEEGWGQSWGLYCTCAEPFEALRAHLGGMLWADTSDGPLFFRFYDPRVLRAFLPTCAAQTARTFFGPVQSFLMEGDTSTLLLEFGLGPDGVERTVVQLETSPGAADDETAVVGSDPESAAPGHGSL